MWILSASMVKRIAPDQRPSTCLGLDSRGARRMALIELGKTWFGDARERRTWEERGFTAAADPQNKPTFAPCPQLSPRYLPSSYHFSKDVPPNDMITPLGSITGKHNESYRTLLTMCRYDQCSWGYDCQSRPDGRLWSLSWLLRGVPGVRGRPGGGVVLIILAPSLPYLNFQFQNSWLTPVYGICTPMFMS